MPIASFVANPTSVVRAGRVHLSEQAPAGAPDVAPPVSLRATGAVCRALAATRTPIAYPDLVAELLATTPGATPEKVEELIDSLWQQTVLLTDLRPPLTTRNPARYVVQRLAGVPAAQSALTRLETLLEALESWDARWCEDVSAYRELEALARSANGVASSETPLQTDMAFALDGRQISRGVGEEVARAAELLLRLSPWPRGLPHLEAYRQTFVSRYGHEREVPLLELIDPHIGLGLPRTTGMVGLVGSIHTSTQCASECCMTWPSAPCATIGWW